MWFDDIIAWNTDEKDKLKKAIFYFFLKSHILITFFADNDIFKY